MNSALYDHDLPEHVVIIQAWTHEATSPLGSAQAASLIINGKGKFEPFTSDSSNTTIHTPREVFHVKQGQRYRFRLIGNNACHMHVRVQDHNLTVIATDGAPIEPIEVESIGLSGGERYDFVIKADQDVGNYWFRLEVADGFYCRPAVQQEFAILRYDGAPEEEPSEEFQEEGDGVLLNPVAPDAPNGINLLEINSKGKYTNKHTGVITISY